MNLKDRLKGVFERPTMPTTVIQDLCAKRSRARRQLVTDPGARFLAARFPLNSLWPAAFDDLRRALRQ
jgi:hypothetical protein